MEQIPSGKLGVMKQGTVYLVGGGPGDPGLITLRAIERLEMADVVVHDRLVNPSLLSYAPQAEWIDVGKQPAHHPVPQDEINRLLIEKAQQGKAVVRLKGGDPFVFGRGGEEAAALSEAGIPFEIVPGVTSAIAAPAYAGIPLTQRDLACSAIIITGHRADCGVNPDLDWRRAAQGADTLVFLMGVHNLPAIVEQLLAAGRASETPVALVEQGTTPAQKTVTGTLADIVSKAAAIKPPAVIVVGDVVRMREQLRWFDSPGVRPLLGRRLAVVHPLVVQTEPSLTMTTNGHGDLSPWHHPEARRFVHLSQALGADVISFPAAHFAPLEDPNPIDDAIRQIRNGNDGSGSRFDWLILMSAEAAVFFLERLYALGGDARWLGSARVAAGTMAAAQTLGAYRIVPDASGCDADDLLSRMGRFAGQRILLPYADGSEVAGWMKCGADVTPQAVCTALPFGTEEVRLRSLIEQGLDAIAFFDPSSVATLAAALGSDCLAEILKEVPVIFSGEGAAPALTQLGLTPVHIVAGFDDDQMTAALVGALDRAGAMV